MSIYARRVWEGLRGDAAWLLSYSRQSDIALRNPLLYEMMVWRGYCAGCYMLNLIPTYDDFYGQGDRSCNGWFANDDNRSAMFDTLLALRYDDAIYYFTDDRARYPRVKEQKVTGAIDDMDRRDAFWDTLRKLFEWEDEDEEWHEGAMSSVTVDICGAEAILNGLKILRSYSTYEQFELTAEHDQVWVYTDPDGIMSITEQEIRELARNGWFPDSDNQGWTHYT